MARRRTDWLRSAEAGLLALVWWAMTLAIPLRHLSALGDSEPLARGLFAVALLPIGALVAGLALRSPVWLAGAVPAACLPAFLMEPRLLGEHVYGYPAFALSAIVLALYLVAALRLRTRGAVRSDRRRVEGKLLAVEGVLAVVLLLFAWWAAFDPSVAEKAASAGVEPGSRALSSVVLVVCWLTAAFVVVRRLGLDRPGAPNEANGGGGTAS